MLYPSEDKIQTLYLYNYTIKYLDKYKNIINKGRANFSTDIKSYTKNSNNNLDLTAEINDNEDGSYNIIFNPSNFGKYSLVTLLNGKKYHEFSFDLACNDGYICPNNDLKCVSDLRDCIPQEIKCDNPSESETKPFKCKGNDACVESMTECPPDDEDKVLKCDYMGSFCLKQRDICPKFLPIQCKRKYPSYPTICDDGICRTSKDSQPNQRVCPIGKILCADLTCQDSIDECYNDWPKCGNNQIRCPDQSCVNDQMNCPSTITCPNPTDKVCPDSTCVANEIYCSAIKKCPKETPYLCTDYSCATEPGSCGHNVGCGHGKKLSPDLICRDG